MAVYLIGALVLARTVGEDRSAVWILIGCYLTLAVAAIGVLWTGGTSPGGFLMVDAITVSGVTMLTGQHPAAVHVILVVIVLTATAMVPFRTAVTIAVVAAAGAAAGMNSGTHDPLLELSAEQVALSERAGTVIGLVVGGFAIVVLARLLRDSLASQAEALAAEQRTNLIQQRFLAMVSHELRTPLTSIRGFAEILHEGRKVISDAEQEEFTQAIATQSAHLSRLVDDVLVVLKIQAGKLSIHREVVDLSVVVESAVAMVAVADTKSLEMGSIPSAPVLADADRLIQVVRNLVENGLKYGGQVVKVRASVEGSVVRLVVEDDGPGIPDDMLESVFDDFVQVGRPAERVTAGFGLGLPIARRLVEAMGGRIWSTSSALGGAAFVVELPVPARAEVAV